MTFFRDPLDVVIPSVFSYALLSNVEHVVYGRPTKPCFKITNFVLPYTLSCIVVFCCCWNINYCRVFFPPILYIYGIIIYFMVGEHFAFICKKI